METKLKEYMFLNLELIPKHPASLQINSKLYICGGVIRYIGEAPNFLSIYI